MIHFFYLLILLLAGHALCDFPLQGQFLSDAKNPIKPIPGISWRKCMQAHVLIHMGMVLLITQSLTCALLEGFIHWVTDCLKCEGLISFDRDQDIHYACKLLWALTAFHRLP